MSRKRCWMVKIVVRYATMIESTTGVVERGVIPGLQHVKCFGTAESGIGEYVRIRLARFIFGLAVVVFARYAIILILF